jgi:hypothetical protein
MAGRLVVRLASLTLLGVLGAGGLAACGSSSSSSTAAPASSPGATLGGLALSTRDLKRIVECLKAAGLTPSLPTSPPTALPTDGLSGSPKGLPSIGPGGLRDPRVVAALRACGITLPSPAGTGTAHPG